MKTQYRSLFEADTPTFAAPAAAGCPELRDYQIDVNERARSHIPKGRRRIIIQSETGSGKGYLIGYNAKSCLAKGRRCLILADRRKLVKQLSDVLHKFDAPYGVIMSEETRLPSLDLIVASRDTLAAWKAHQRKMPEPFSLIQVDECHKAMGETYQDLLSLWPNAVVLGYTATPARGDGKYLSDFFQALECAVPSSELIRRGFLVQPEVYWPKQLAKARRKGLRKGTLTGDPVEHWQEHAAGLATIAFCETIIDSLSLRDRFNKAGIAAEHVDADTPDHERERCYDRLQGGETKILCSVGLLIEGIDIAEISCALMWRKFGSLVQFRQACGRTMRPCPRIGKDRAVILDHSGASGEHGAPGEDIEWSLDKSTTVGERQAKKITSQPMIVCRSCGFCYNGKPSCPKCNASTPKERRKFTLADQAAQHDEVLSRYDRSSEEGRAEIQTSTLKLYNRCLGIAANRNGTYGMAATLFRKESGMWPEDAELPEGTKIPPADRRYDKIKDIYPELVRRRATV
jgi:DNA repair protein RadD